MPTDIPVDHVRNMRNQGFDNTQVISALQNDGYSSTQIFDAMNQVEMEPNGVPSISEDTPTQWDYPPGAGPHAETGNDPAYRTSAPVPGLPPRNDFAQQPKPRPQASNPAPRQSDWQDQGFYNNPPELRMPAPPQRAPEPAPQGHSDSSETEELIEAIIDEKWKDLVSDIQKMIEWKNLTETKIIAMDQKFKDLQGQFDNLHKALIGKISEYDKNILDVGSELKAMEKVFSNILPTFTRNVQDLNAITQRMRGPYNPPNAPQM